LKQLEKINNLVERGKDKVHRVIRAIPFFPCKDLGEIASFLTFSKDRIRDLIDLGYDDGKAVLASLG
jgi:butyrate kinase